MTPRCPVWWSDARRGDLVDRGQQTLAAPGLNHRGCRAELGSPSLDPRVGLSRQHHHWNPAGLGATLEGVEHLEPRHIGEMEIQQDEVDSAGLDEAEPGIDPDLAVEIFVLEAHAAK